MEDLFAPSTRFRDLYRALDDHDGLWDIEEGIDGLVELELVAGSSAEDTFLLCGFTWSDFYLWARGKIVWISPDFYFDLTSIDTDFQLEYRSFLTVTADEDTSEDPEFVCVCASSEAHATVACDILLRLLTTCEPREVHLQGGHDSNLVPISGLAFSHFLVQSQNLRVLGLRCLSLNTCHCRAIDTLTRTDLQIKLYSCELTEPGEEIMLESIRQNRGPNVLHACRIDTRPLARALRGNNSVTTLAPHNQCSDEERLVLVEALAENEGLVTLYLSAASISITDEIWIALWRSVARHPTLEKLILPQSQWRRTWRDGNTDAQKTLRMQAMVDALRINTVMHTISLSLVDFDEDILDSTVYPLLLANRYRPHVCAISEEEGPWRRKLLGRALASISSNPSLIWMFISGNANVRVGPTPPE
jgi:hypothetical protein